MNLMTPRAGLPRLPPAQAGRVRRLMLRLSPVRLRASAAVARGDQMRDVGDWRAAAFAYAEGLSINPFLPHIWVQFGHALKESGDPRAAEDAYRVAVDQEPANADTFLNLGHALKLQGRMTDAAFAYMRALDLEGLARHSTVELAGMARNAQPFSLETLAEALGAGPGDRSSVVLHVSRLVEALFAGAPTRADLASMRLVLELADSGEDVLLCGGRRTSPGLRRLPASLFAEACRAMLEGRADTQPGADLLALLNLVTASGAPCVFADGAVIVDFAGDDIEGDFDREVRALRRSQNIRTLVYLPTAAEAFAAEGAQASHELFAAMPQTLAVLVDDEEDAAAVADWAQGRGLRLRDGAVRVLSRSEAGRPAALVAIARQFASDGPADLPTLQVRPGVYYGMGVDPEAEESAAPALARCGEGWWWPENWGCWTRPGGASLLIDPTGGPGDYELLIGLRSSLEGECRFVLSLDDLDSDEGVLPAARTDWCSVDLSLRGGPVRLKVTGVETHRQGPGGAPASVGVIGFALRPRPVGRGDGA